MGLKLFHQRVLALAALVYAIGAWNGSGFPNADEHYQIIEFAQWKLGELPAGKLTWEFHEGIRSSLLPWVATGVFSAAKAAGIHDPFALAALLRLLTAALALVALSAFVRATAGQVPAPARKVYIVSAYFLWFLPLLLVRFSSEGWSGIFLLGMLATILRRGWLWPLRAGLWAAVAILCRPPVGLIVLSCMAWMKWVRRDHWAHLVKIGAWAFVLLLTSCALDQAFYGGPVHTTWNYLRMGFTGDPARFDVLPWYYYSPWILKYAIPPIGAAILLALVILLFKQPRHLVLWCMLPFLLAHTLIPHKELRFLYPLAALVPWLLVQAWALAAAAWDSRAWWPRIAGRSAWALLAAVNAVALLAATALPADGGRERLARAARQQAITGPVTVNYWMDTVPPWAIRVPPFYMPARAVENMVTDPCLPLAHATDSIQLLVADRPLPPCPAGHGWHWQPVQQLERPWEAMVRRTYLWEDARRGWQLYSRDPGPATLAP